MRLRNITLLSITFLLTLLYLPAKADHLSTKLTFSARLNGANEVPAVSTPGLGVGSFLLNATRDTLCISVAVTGLSGTITGMHIHEGAAGTTGGVVYDLTPEVLATRATAKIAITASDLDKMLKGLYYLNVHTAANPNGEIRGQLVLEKDNGYHSILDESYVSSGASGVGHATYTLSLDKRFLDINVITYGLTGPIVAAHFHSVATGNVVAGLDSLINGHRINGRLDASAIDPALLNGGYYLNIHTAANAMGEIAGLTMTRSDALTFDAALNGTLLSTGATSNGNAYMMLSPTFDTLRYAVAWDTLSGTLTGIHFHHSSGNVVHDIGPNVMGNWASGMWVNPPDSVILDMLAGDTYINIHTPSYPSGEIAGRTLRHAREGYPINIDAPQTVPVANSYGLGGGIVTVNRSQSNAHFMVVVSDLTGPITAAHFHKGIMGESGGVLFTLPFTNNAAYGYWTEASAMPFVTGNSLQFRRDSIYVNVHTDANPSGEVRGQATRNGNCFEAILGVEDQLVSNEMLGLYPNPASTRINLTWEGNRHPAQIEVIDLTGKVMLSQSWSENGYDISQLPAGMYLLRTKDKEYNSTATRFTVVRQ